MSNFEQMRVTNAAGTAINPARKEDVEALPSGMNDALFILRQIRKILEPLATQDLQQRQRVVIDAGSITTLPTVANVTTVATLTTVTNNVPANVVQFNGVDPRFFLMDTARNAYANGIRSKLT